MKQYPVKTRYERYCQDTTENIHPAVVDRFENIIGPARRTPENLHMYRLGFLAGQNYPLLSQSAGPDFDPDSKITALVNNILKASVNINTIQDSLTIALIMATREAHTLQKYIEDDLRGGSDE